MSYDAILIGAGMSGLAAGIRLAQFDRRVVVLEKHNVWGGLNSFYTIGGRPFDVGLHALTNYAAKGERGLPLTKLLRQLRIRHADLRLGEQNHSDIHFPGVRLRFTNDFEFLREDVARAFPTEASRFDALAQAVRDYDITREDLPPTSARKELAILLRDPLLIEMLLLPTCYYGSAQEDDVDWYQFVVLFRSLFLEGLSRPEGGIRTLLNLLVKRFKSLGGELRMSSGVRRILVSNGKACGVELEDGTQLESSEILSSAGYVETMRLCEGDPAAPTVSPAERGRLSFLESISVLDRSVTDVADGAATSFFSTDERLHYRVPDDPIDLRSGVLSAPGNYRSEEPLPEPHLRLTVLANFDRWAELDEDTYVATKERCADEATQAATAYIPDWRPDTVFRDIFTPRTIRHFTSRANGAVYGSPKKRLDGRTAIEGLHLCGTDQGYLGVVGSMISGVAMANRYALVPA